MCWANSWGDKDHKILSFFGVEEFIFGCGGCMITLSNLNISYWVVHFFLGREVEIHLLQSFGLNVWNFVVRMTRVLSMLRLKA